MLRPIYDLLRYMSMTVDEIACRVGSYSARSLCQQFTKNCQQTPDGRRQAIRGERDEGKFRV